MPVVLQARGPIIEAVHPFSAVAVRGDSGAVVWELGAAVSTTWRSASKPFQLEQSLEALGARAADFATRELAVGAASHNGEPVHVALVEGLLERFGLGTDALRCGTHPPVHEASAAAILRAGGAFCAVHNNCSGKHAFMLGASLAQGWSLEYRPPAHPLQQRNRRRLEALCGYDAELATDGCGVPTFGFPLDGLARAWATLAVQMGATPGDARSTLGRIGWAMAQSPELTSGTGRFDLELMGGAREPMAVKIGALGVFCIALPARGLGLAVKIHTGVGDALAAAVSTTLASAAPGAFEAPPEWALLQVRNVVGDVVGGWRVADRAAGPQG